MTNRYYDKSKEILEDRKDREQKAAAERQKTETEAAEARKERLRQIAEVLKATFGAELEEMAQAMRLLGVEGEFRLEPANPNLGTPLPTVKVRLIKGDGSQTCAPRVQVQVMGEGEKLQINSSYTVKPRLNTFRNEPAKWDHVEEVALDALTRDYVQQVLDRWVEQVLPREELR